MHIERRGSLRSRRMRRNSVGFCVQCTYFSLFIDYSVSRGNSETRHAVAYSRHSDNFPGLAARSEWTERRRRNHGVPTSRIPARGDWHRRNLRRLELTQQRATDTRTCTRGVDIADVWTTARTASNLRRSGEHACTVVVDIGACLPRLNRVGTVLGSLHR